MDSQSTCEHSEVTRTAKQISFKPHFIPINNLLKIQLKNHKLNGFHNRDSRLPSSSHIESIEDIMNEYRTNPYFQIKMDKLLKESERHELEAFGEPAKNRLSSSPREGQEMTGYGTFRRGQILREHQFYREMSRIKDLLQRSNSRMEKNDGKK